MCGERARTLKRQLAGCRFIPACAGNAHLARWAEPAQRAVHPRVCGERSGTPPVSVFQSGSSPRVRGTPPEGGGGQRHRRFIPACAGNARNLRPPMNTGTGSSPRVRGTPGRREADDRRSRFIPACAGNASWNVTLLITTAVHPRVCGERGAPHEIRQGDCGSSPRVRGTLVASGVAGASRRFIPACAGNAPREWGCRFGTPVHPRVCGERMYRPPFFARGNGSSPRVRGTQLNPSAWME